MLTHASPPAQAVPAPWMGNVTYEDRYWMRHAEVEAASWAQRILSGEGAGRLWWQLAMDLLQQAYGELRLNLWAAQRGLVLTDNGESSSDAEG